MEIKTLIATVVIAAVTGGIVGWLVGGQPVTVAPSAGGTTQSYFDAKGGFRVNGTTVIDSSANVDANVTTSSLKVGAGDATTYTYFGAGDGCAAIFFTSSTTQTVQATSTSFCN